MASNRIGFLLLASGPKVDRQLLQELERDRGTDFGPGHRYFQKKYKDEDKELRKNNIHSDNAHNERIKGMGYASIERKVSQRSRL